jgi:long-subunit fatty acid transport protein
MGARYASRRSGRVDGERGDPMRDERWDLELDAVYIFSSQMDVISVDIPFLPDLAERGVKFDLPHHWKDQVSLRLGGDINIVPDTLALRAGAHYETSAINPRYASIDFQPGQRVGLHGGLTFRVGRVDLLAAYSHIFQETIEVGWEQAEFRQVTVETPETAAQARQPVIVNAGKYTNSFDVISIGVNVHL